MNASKELYDKTAHRYDLRQSNPWTELARKRELELLDKFAAGRILDVGCGNGFHLAYLSNKKQSGLFGIDVSFGMLKEAAKNLSLGLTCSSAEHLPFPDGRFDTALCMLMVLNMCDCGAALREIARVLRKGGRAIFSVASIWDNDGKPVKNTRIENFRLKLKLFEKKDLDEALEAAGLKAVYFDSLFRYPKTKPKWGNFTSLTDEQKELLCKEADRQPELGAVYFLVAEKL